MQIVDLRSERNTLGELAYGHLLRLILSHELQPGTAFGQRISQQAWG